MRAMKLRGLIGFGFLALAVSGCQLGTASKGDQEPVVVINDLRLTVEDLKDELATVPPAARQITLAGGREPEWVARVIERELIVQEAQRQGLDRSPKFMRSVERFWKEALLQQEVQRKAQEVSSSVFVYEPEIEARYTELTGQGKIPSGDSLETHREEIKRMIRREKESEVMERWVSGLRSNARVEVNHQGLEKLK